MVEEPATEKKLKFPEIPKLDDYKICPPVGYWKSFPFRDLPSRPTTKVNVKALSELIKERSQKMRNSEILRAKKAVDFLSKGAPSHQLKNLPAISCNNSESAYIYGVNLSDTIAEWIKEGYVSGPFIYPPVKNFRSNPLKMVPQKGKIRPVLNVSSPIGRSLNDNVSPSGPEKVIMSSAKKFGQSVLKAGKGATMTKFDTKNAYKIVPCRTDDLRLQGFKWCDRFFVETTQPFGAKTAVSNYDTVGHTVQSVTQAVCDIPKDLVHRQLDDVPILGPKGTDWCQKFTNEYADVCKKLNIELAPDCPDNDKAFRNESSGKVLGIIFECADCSWKLPEDKRIEYMNAVHKSISENCMNIEDCQSLLGKLAFVSSMCEPLRTFKKPLQNYLSTMLESGVENVELPQEVLSDLLFWWGFLNNADRNIPIQMEHDSPPLRCKVITTDAAGWRSNSSSTERVGMGCVGIDEEGEIFMANQLFWESKSSRYFCDEEFKHLGSKTTTLEFTGIVIPFLICPEKLTNQIVMIQVDNIGCYYAWQNGYCKEDNMASILVRLLVLLSSWLSCEVLVVHHPRESSWESKLADRLSRTRSTTTQDKRLVDGFNLRNLPKSFSDWLDSPAEDWNMPKSVIVELSSNISLP